MSKNLRFGYHSSDKLMWKKTPGKFTSRERADKSQDATAWGQGGTARRLIPRRGVLSVRVRGQSETTQDSGPLSVAPFGLEKLSTV